MKKTEEERFWSFVDIREGKDACWLWTGCCSQYGHGQFKHKRGRIAHRFSWELHNGKLIPEGMCIYHHCDNPPCVNPAHLFIGTHADNMQDMASKGRSLRGEKNIKAVLNEEDVLNIREQCNIIQLAQQYNVSPRTILNVITGHTWKHIR